MKAGLLDKNTLYKKLILIVLMIKKNRKEKKCIK